MVVRSSAVVIMSALTVTAFAAAESTSELPPLVGRPVSLSVVRAGQLALAPGGNRLALADRFANRIYVFDSNGEVLWSVGDGVMLAQPTALVWTSDRELMFSQWDSRALCRVTEEDPARIDTVADLSVVLGDKGRILRLYQRRDRTFLALTEKPDGLRHLDIEWKQVRVLVPGGSGRGKIGRASVCAQLASGRLAIIGERTFPVQIFDADGKLLLSGDWNQPSLRSVWEATAATVDTRDVIWVADATNSQFRRYDQTGTLLDTRLFGTPGARPVGMVATADYKLIVVNETGRVDIYDLSQEQ